MAIQDTVREKLRSQIVKDLVQKGDTQTLRAVYAKLLEMDPGNKEVLAAMEQLQLMEQKGEEKRRSEYFKNADKTILQFMKEGDLVSAQQAVLEMLSYYPENKRYQALLEKVESKQSRSYNKKLSAFFEVAVPALKEEYRVDKEAFIVL